jgi:DNA gyrase/topoisomerase IV subunit B
MCEGEARLRGQLERVMKEHEFNGLLESIKQAGKIRRGKMNAGRIFDILIGDKVEPRREFIQNHTLEVSELDV